jgi:ABC-type nitrate/sulfonate/bicarbonate transport system permease component
LALCAVIGVPVGLLIGTSLRASKSTQWIIDFCRTIPAIALLPLVLLLFGPTFRMEITMIVLAAIWPLLIQSMYAARQVEPLLKWVVRVFRISTTDRLRYLWAPSVSLFVFTGLRLAATMALLMTISAEYIGGAAGLGLELSYMDQGLNRPEVFAYAITAGIIGLLINMIIIRVQRRLLWWHPIIRGERSV